MLERMIETLRARAQRFTHSEITTEILRQKIKELEQKEFISSNDPQALRDLEKLEILRHQLSNIQDQAERDTQSRSISNGYANMLREYQESGELPRGSEELYENYLKWLDGTENHRRLFYTREMEKFRTIWPAATWSNRMGMLRWLGRYGVRRIAFERPFYHLSRKAMRWALRDLKRR